MRIDQLYPSAQTLDVVDGLGEPTQIKLTVVGPDSKNYRDAAKKAMRAMNGKDAQNDVDVIEKANAEIFAACIVGWEGFTDHNDQQVPFCTAKALELMLTPELTFMREQVEAFVSERARFFRGSAQAA